jgi:hypothetical protein
MSQHTVKYVEEPFDARVRELEWQRAGLQQTASGYGRKLTSRYEIRLQGETRWRRVYVTQFSNAGTHWITRGGEPFHVVRAADLEAALEKAVPRG